MRKIIFSPPLVSIGLPAYNNEKCIGEVLDGLLAQTYTNLEIIISDDASDDSTLDICLGYAKKDARIKVFEQKSNIGANSNFKFVLDEASGKYFAWVAADDWRSKNFIEENLKFLEANPGYVASTSRNGFDNQLDANIDFSIEGTEFERFKAFFNNCWKSNGIYYSLIRTYVLKLCGEIGRNFFGVDWIVDLHLARYGNIARIKSGYLIFGTNGVSHNNPYKPFRNKVIEIVFPFYELTKCVIKYSFRFTMFQRFMVYMWLLKLNLRASYGSFRWLIMNNCK